METSTTLDSVRGDSVVPPTHVRGATVAEQIAVIGAGLMGSGIAQVSAQAGYQVLLLSLIHI